MGGWNFTFCYHNKMRRFRWLASTIVPLATWRRFAENFPLQIQKTSKRLQREIPQIYVVLICFLFAIISLLCLSLMFYAWWVFNSLPGELLGISTAEKEAEKFYDWDDYRLNGSVIVCGVLLCGQISVAITFVLQKVMQINFRGQVCVKNAYKSFHVP